MTDNYLFSLDIDGIQNYIFNTNRLKTIAGASKIIDRLNNTETVKKLNKKYGFNDAPKLSDNFIYSNGGATKVLFAHKKYAEAFEKEMHKMYAEYGISITTHIERVTGSEKDALDEAGKTIAQKKYNKKFFTMPVSSPYLKICESCGKEYAVRKEEKLKQNDQEPLLVCKYCYNKAEEKIEEIRGFDDLIFSQDLNKIKGKDNMVALVVMDGNKMGQKIDNLLNTSDDQSAFKKLKNFSGKVESIIHYVFKHLIKKQPSGSNIDFIRPVIVGGDDVAFIIKAEYGLEFTIKLIKQIKEMSATQENKPFFSGGIEMSAGIVFMKHNYPVSIGYSIAESLLKSAKKASNENNDEAMIDFHIMQTASADNISGIRDNEYAYCDVDGEKCLLTQKPYSITDIEEYVGKIKNLKSIFKTSGNKLKKIRDIIRLGREASRFELLKIAVKMDDQNRKEFLKKFIEKDNLWVEKDGRFQTALLDLVEMNDLMTD